jgi:thiamine transport system permease protein
MVVAFGLLAVWGRAGWIGELGTALTGRPFDMPIFGLGGVVAAHVVLDGAFATRILLARLDSIPVLRLKTGQSLGLGAWTRFALIDWPAMRTTLPGLVAVIFLLAFTSFPIVLLLGGGPSVQTLEVAIYSAVRLDFDLGKAVTLALVQIALCTLIILIAASVAPLPSVLGRSGAPRWRDPGTTRLLQAAVLVLGTLGFVSPLLAVLASGIDGLTTFILSATFWNAAFTSAWVGLASAALTLLLAFAIAGGRAGTADRLVHAVVSAPAFAYLAVPAVVLSLGAFLLVRDASLPTEGMAPLIVVVANALLSLPFALITLAPPLETVAQTRGRLIRSLGLGGLRQFTEIEWPLLARDAGIAFALAFCFSLGDLGVIALLGTQHFVTLPLLMLRALGAYRTDDAAVIAALMLIGAVAAFALLPRLFESLADARA